VNSKAGGFTHMPVAKGQCSLCHNPHGAAAPHNLKPTAIQACVKCHNPSAAGFATAHKGYAVANSDCTRCHDPHSFQKERALLRKVAHAPFMKGNCTLCHEKAPSTALVKPATELCFGCHSKEKIVPQQDSAGKTMNVHAPAQAALCIKCHDPHLSDTPAGLKDKPSVVCYACHQNIQKAAKASHTHKPVADGNCIACHKPHAAVEKGLLQESQEKLCIRCHKEQAMHAHPTGDKAKDPNTGEPVRCASCHAIHGSEFTSLLPKDQNALCLDCHRIEAEESKVK